MKMKLAVVMRIKKELLVAVMRMLNDLVFFLWKCNFRILALFMCVGIALDILSTHVLWSVTLIHCSILI